jgi:hypothetical protein
MIPSLSPEQMPRQSVDVLFHLHVESTSLNCRQHPSLLPSASLRSHSEKFVLFMVETIIFLSITLLWKFRLKRLIKANHSKGWDAKLLAYVPQTRDTVAGLPGGCRSSLSRGGAHGHTRRRAVPMPISSMPFTCYLACVARVLLESRPPPAPV